MSSTERYLRLKDSGMEYRCSPPVEHGTSSWYCHRVWQLEISKRRVWVGMPGFPRLNRVRAPVRLALINRSKHMKDSSGKTSVDTRYLKSGQIRLRFKLNQSAYRQIVHAMYLTGYVHPNAALDAMALNCVTCYPFSIATNKYTAVGKQRLSIRLYPDQYKIVRMALDAARWHVKTDEDALLLLSNWFTESEKIKYPNDEKVTKKSSCFLRKLVDRKLEVCN